MATVGFKGLIIRQHDGSFFSCTFCVVFKIFTLFYKNVVH